MRDLIEQLRDATEGLPEDPWKYFKKPSGTVLIPVSRLKTTRRRSGGVREAESRMRLAYRGKGTKRAPISVKKSGDVYTVVDGNSTSDIAKRSGWKKIPALVS